MKTNTVDATANTTTYASITPELAEANPDYNLIFMHQFKKWAGSPFTQSIIKEPLTDDYLIHAEKIRLGKWSELDFSSQDFERSLYKALRLKAIPSVQLLGTALLLTHAYQLFSEEKSPANIEQYSYDDTNGPYDIMDIHYAKKAEIQKELQKALSALPENEKFYFAIELSEEHAIDLLYHCTRIAMIGTMLSKFKFILRKFLEDRNASPELLTHTDSLTSESDKSYFLNKSPTSKIMNFLLSLKQKNSFSEDMSFIAAGLRLDAQAPNIEFSRKNKIVFIVQNFRMYEVMLQAMHGKDASLPLYTAGPFSPLYMREADEGTLTYFKGSQYRPVELIHPDLTPTKLQHGKKVHAFSATWHDMFYHLMQNSANPWKPYIREIRKHFEIEKRIPMNKVIWRLIDMDYTPSTEWRLAHDKNEASRNLISRIWHYLIQNENATLFTQENLLGIAILLKHHAQWEKMLGINQSHVEIILDYNKDSCLDFAETFKKMQSYIDADKNRNIESLSPTYYVLRFIIGDAENAEELAKKAVAANIISWERNGGLQIAAKYSFSKRIFSLEKYPMTGTGIANMLKQALAAYEKENLNALDIKISDIAIREPKAGVQEKTLANNNSPKAPTHNLQFIRNKPVENKNENHTALQPKRNTFYD